jgi:hypothetical protein
MSRPAKYRNAAERQKAYRERNKPAATDNPYAGLIADIELSIETLRATVTKRAQKSDPVEIYLSHGYAQLRINGAFNSSLNPLVIRHMIRVGELVETRRDIWGSFYQLESIYRN